MLIDSQNTLSWEQAVTVDAISTNVIDLLPTSGALNAGSTGGPGANVIRDIGAGETLYFHSVVTTAFTTGDGATLTVTLESDSAAGLDSSATVHDTYITTVAAATLVAGYWIAAGVPLPPGAYERYLGARYVTTTGDMTGGKVSSWISNNRMDTRGYKAGSITGVN
jgi:hypothetical protein